eukprot:scaffold180_cov311-Pinguiococcus_pyrenoidosus.AAC.30
MPLAEAVHRLSRRHWKLSRRFNRRKVVCGQRKFPHFFVWSPGKQSIPRRGSRNELRRGIGLPQKRESAPCGVGRRRHLQHTAILGELQRIQGPSRLSRLNKRSN